MVNLAEIASGYNLLESIDLHQLVINGILALAIIIVGVFIGKIICVGLGLLSKKLELSKYIKGTFIELFLVVIRWSVYLIFINFSLHQLGIPVLTSFFTNTFIIVPSLVGGLILLLIGFAIAFYLREIFNRSETKVRNLISQAVFFFVAYLFGIYALRTALISFDEWTTNMIILILTAVIAGAIAYVYVIKSLRGDNNN